MTQCVVSDTRVCVRGVLTHLNRGQALVEFLQHNNAHHYPVVRYVLLASEKHGGMANLVDKSINKVVFVFLLHKYKNVSK